MLHHLLDMHSHLLLALEASRALEQHRVLGNLCLCLLAVAGGCVLVHASLWAPKLGAVFAALVHKLKPCRLVLKSSDQ